MTDMNRDADGIDTGSDMAFEARFWIFQSAAWALLACLIAIGLIGGFGRGYFSFDKRPLSGGGELEFEKRIRYKTPTSYRLIVVRPPPGADAAADVRINLDSGLLQKLDLKLADGTPTPASVEAYGQGVVLVFKPSPGAESLQIKLALEPRAVGIVQGSIGVSGSAPLEIRQFIYP